MKNFVVFFSLILSFSLFAASPDVACLNKGKELKIDNATVLDWKYKSANQYHDRGHIAGTLLYVYPDQNGHHHYQVQIGNNNKDTIEVIYNKGFGDIPQIRLGSPFEACGDYITSNAPGGGYDASPDGAIIHWVHRSKNTKTHDAGFLVINGVIYGMK